MLLFHQLPAHGLQQLFAEPVARPHVRCMACTTRSTRPLVLDAARVFTCTKARSHNARPPVGFLLLSTCCVHMLAGRNASASFQPARQHLLPGMQPVQAPASQATVPQVSRAWAAKCARTSVQSGSVQSNSVQFSSSVLDVLSICDGVLNVLSVRDRYRDRRLRHGRDGGRRHARHGRRR